MFRLANFCELKFLSAEYVEEYPPLFNMIGMASIIKIWRRRTCRDKPLDRQYSYGLLSILRNFLENIYNNFAMSLLMSVKVHFLTNEAINIVSESKYL